MSGKHILQSSLIALVAFVSCSYGSQEGRPLRFGLSASVEANDNRDATERDKESNIDFFLRPYISYHLDGLTTRLRLRYEPAFRYRTEPGDDQDEIDLQHRIDIRARHELSERARVRLNNTFVKIDDPQIEEGGAIVRADRSYILNTLRAGLNYDVGLLSNIDVAAQSTIRRYDDSDIAALSDKDEYGIGLAFRHTLSETLVALVSGSIETYRFEDTPAVSRDFDSLTGSAGLEYRFLPQLLGSLSVGGQTRSYDDSSLEVGDNLYVSAELSGNVGADLVMGIISGYGVRDADVAPYASQEYAEFRGYADFQATPLLALRGALTYRTSDYDAVRELGLAGGNEDVIVFDAQVTYSLTDTTSIMAGHRFEDISADDELSNSYTRNISRLGMRLDF